MLYIGCLGFIIETAMSYVGTLPGAEHQLPLLRFGQPQVDGNVRDCQDLPGGPEQTWRQCVEQSALLRFIHAFSLVGKHPCCNHQGGSALIGISLHTKVFSWLPRWKASLQRMHVSSAPFRCQLHLAIDSTRLSHCLHLRIYISSIGGTHGEHAWSSTPLPGSDTLWFRTVAHMTVTTQYLLHPGGTNKMSNNNATDQADVQASQAPQEHLWRRHAVMLGLISN